MGSHEERRRSDEASEAKPVKDPKRNRIRRDEGWDNEEDAPRNHTPGAATATQLKKVEAPVEDSEEVDWDEEDDTDDMEPYDHLDDEDEEEEAAEEDVGEDEEDEED